MIASVRSAALLVATSALALLPAVAPRSARAETQPAVARPTFQLGSELRAAGTAFFVKAPDEVGVAAVAAAHSLSLDELARTQEVEFRLGQTQQRVAVSSRFLARPGRPYHASGATLRDDYLVFALDAQPRGVRILEIDPRPLVATGERVQILGVPASIPQDEDDLFGTVASASAEKIEVDLDAKADLRGWGGAPVLSYDSRKVIGMLQAAQPKGGTLRLSVSPVEAIVSAIAEPLDGGLGRAFAGFRAEDGGAAPRVPPPQVAENTAGVLPASQRPLPRKTSTAASPPATVDDEPAPVPTTSGKQSRRAAAAATARRAHAGGPVLPQGAGGRTDLQLLIEQPVDGAIFGEANGAFVAGRALALRGAMKRFDVVIVIDTSGSTMQSAGADVNGNGVVGRDRFGGLFGVQSTDPGDSILSAEVAAARALLKGLDPRSTRVGLITFAGQPPDGGGGGFVFRTRQPRAAITEEPLTTEYGRIEQALRRVLERGPEGATHMAAGVDQATIELLGLEGGLSEPDKTSEKFVLFLTDGQPTLPYGPGFDSDNTRAVLRAADRAHKAGIRVHSFAIGPEALDGPVAAVELAERTEGQFTPVRNPGELTDVIEQVSFADIQEITVRNVTTGAPADVLQANADGSFGALVPLASGKNKLEVTARASDGATALSGVTVVYTPGGQDPVLPVELVALHNRLLEQKLIELRRGRLDSERTRVEETRKELALQIEQERASAQDRAAQQRKELELEVDKAPPPADDSTPP